MDAVEKGEVSVAAAAELAELPPEKQKVTLAQGKKAVSSQVKKLRGCKANKRQRREDKTHPEGNGQAKSVIETANSVKDTTDTLTVRKPTSHVERQTLAESLLTFLGREECELCAGMDTGEAIWVLRRRSSQGRWGNKIEKACALNLRCSPRNKPASGPGSPAAWPQEDMGPDSVLEYLNTPAKVGAVAYQDTVPFLIALRDCE